MMDQRLQDTILRESGATAFEKGEILQELWSGYGQIQRFHFEDGLYSTAIAKHIQLPEESHHPRGWNTSLSHERKVRSYQVESHFYQHQNWLCGSECRTPRLLAQGQVGRESLLLLEDLDEAGYPLRLQEVDSQKLASCLQWLAEFHATFLTDEEVVVPELWEVGCYWHLATRPDELAALGNDPLAVAAPRVDEILRSVRYQTLLHGDAKVANFCFSAEGAQVAALDFQYVGPGCGMKDLAYFLGSCLSEGEIAAREEDLLGSYFDFLTTALERRDSQLDYDALIREWTSLYRYAWTDFHRFLKGWCPTHWKLNRYSERLVAQVLSEIE